MSGAQPFKDRVEVATLDPFHAALAGSDPFDVFQLDAPVVDDVRHPVQPPAWAVRFQNHWWLV